MQIRKEAEERTLRKFLRGSFSDALPPLASSKSLDVGSALASATPPSTADAGRPLAPHRPKTSSGARETARMGAAVGPPLTAITRRKSAPGGHIVYTVQVS